MALGTALVSWNHNYRGAPTRREQGECDGDRWCDSGLFLGHCNDLLNCLSQEVVEPCGWIVWLSLKFSSVGGGTKECFTFELDLTLNNLANMARFKSQQDSCESVANKKRVLQVECKLPLKMRKGSQPVASTINADSLFQRPHHQVSNESVKPSISLNTGGAQDLYPALGLPVFSSKLTCDKNTQNPPSHTICPMPMPSR